MAKINDTSAYPTVTPASGDLIIGTDVSDSNNTKTFTAGSLVDLATKSEISFVEQLDFGGGRTATSSTLDFTNNYGYVLHFFGVKGATDAGFILRLASVPQINQRIIADNSIDFESIGVWGRIVVYQLETDGTGDIVVRTDLVYGNTSLTLTEVTDNYLLSASGTLSTASIVFDDDVATAEDNILLYSIPRA